MSIGLYIDPADGIEPVMNLRDEEFLGKLLIQKPTTATLEAQRDKSDLALWSDRSRVESGKVGAAVVWRDSPVDRWKSCKLLLRKNKKVLDAKL